MTTELSFLLDLLLTHKLPTATKTAVAERIKSVEVELHTKGGQISIPRMPYVSQPSMPIQSPSTQAILDRNPDLIPPPPVPVAVIAQTPAAQAAMEARNKAISDAQAGRGSSPKKYHGAP